MQFKKLRSDIRSVVAWGVPLTSPLEITSWTAIIHQRIPSLHKNASEKSAHENICRRVNQGEQRRRERKRAEMGAVDAAQNSLRISERRKESGCKCVLCSPKHSCLSDQHITWQNPAIYQSRDQKIEVGQLCSRSCHCQVVNKATKPGHIHPTSQS